MKKYLTDGDGWNEEHIDETGVSDFLSQCSAVKYELDNCVRGQWAISGDEPSDLLDELYRLKEELEQVICNVEDNIERESK
tara:strand:+ start:23 stop:265 length:243 start_codon:yes stop_codon:yes gene_type:complete